VGVVSVELFFFQRGQDRRREDPFDAASVQGQNSEGLPGFPRHNCAAFMQDAG